MDPRLASSGSTAALNGATTAAPSFTTDMVGAYGIDLVVNDGIVASAADRVTITATNRAPVAFAGDDGTVTAGEPLVLGGTASDADGHPVTHTWTLVSKPIGSAATLAADAALDAALAIDVAGAYVVRLEVRDSWSTSADDRTITATSPYSGGEVTGTTTAMNAELTAIAARIDAVLALGYNTINADQVMKRLTGKEAPTKPADSMTVIDIRSPADFAKGHIPGAINIPFAQLPDVLLGNLAALGTKEIAVASYNGNDGNMANLLINLARVPDPVPSPLPSPVTWPVSRTIFGGMAAWTYDRELTPTRFDDDKNVRRIEDGAVTATATPGVDQGAFPAIAQFSAATDTPSRKALVRARAFVAELVAEGGSGPEAFWVDFVDYSALLADADPGNDPVIVSVRNLVDYNKGHVPGAFNAPYGQIAKVANLKNVSPSERLYVYCYTGHTGALATVALGIMGYEARNVLYGLNGWTLSSAASSGQLARFDVTRGWDFPLNDTAGESLATYVPPATGCKGCHTNLTALYADFSYTEPPVPGVENEGEG